MFEHKLIPQVHWETLGNDGNATTYRSKIPGGWFIYIVTKVGETSGLTFYPDPEHTWDGHSIK